MHINQHPVETLYENTRTKIWSTQSILAQTYYKIENKDKRICNFFSSFKQMGKNKFDSLM